MPNCKGIMVISDGAASDQALRAIVAGNGDGRVRYVPLTRIDRILTNLPRSDGSANYRHFTQILRGVLASTTEAIYLHDADAFWLEEGGVESQYREFRERGMYTLGVTSRIDPMFKERGLDIPGTWELMFSNSWARKRRPVDMKGGWYPVPNDEWRWFDTLLYGQFMDYASGKVGVMANPPKLVHFYATITEYRSWQRAAGSQATDKLFSLLLLSVLAEALPSAQRDLPLPRPHELERGLRDAQAEVSYLGPSAADKYANFRRRIDALCSSPVFGNDVALRIRDLVAPFDEHFFSAS
jgi:hypothetical protein